ncbi:hypothetical protein QYS48_03010 [Marivirga arenosa]|uniref:O-antigen ligase domain-containing protein n=1 Tax=Marivirga arenosa TaxID=3059076 RepID=A0AA49JDM4_9BACT|nr:hypothetical protein [Marivirga sp. ABR2-2]WKK86013.2 hypothetical protein QYS48_03010 [Marivirga sp. ABR2-2]
MNNSAAHIDYKFHLFTFYLLLMIRTFEREVGFYERLEKILMLICFIVFSYYLLFSFLNLPSSLNIYNRGTAAGGYSYRIAGPTTLAFILVACLKIWNKTKWNLIYTFTFLFGLITILLQGSLQYLMIYVIVNGLLFIKKDKWLIILPIIFIALFAIVANTAQFFFNEKLTEKIGYITKPWEYSTVKHRVETVNLMLDKTTGSYQEIFFGSGVGVTSTYFEINEISPSLSRQRTFHEIDNGFYYVYHRFGLVGLSIFLLFHLYLLFGSKVNLRFKLAFLAIFLISNLLSIHYFTNAFFVLFLILFLNKHNRSAANHPNNSKEIIAFKNQG